MSSHNKFSHMIANNVQEIAANPDHTKEHLRVGSDVQVTTKVPDALKHFANLSAMIIQIFTFSMSFEQHENQGLIAYILNFNSVTPSAVTWMRELQTRVYGRGFALLLKHLRPGQLLIVHEDYLAPMVPGLYTSSVGDPPLSQSVFSKLPEAQDEQQEDQQMTEKEIQHMHNAVDLLLNADRSMHAGKKAETDAAAGTPP